MKMNSSIIEVGRNPNGSFYAAEVGGGDIAFAEDSLDALAGPESLGEAVGWYVATQPQHSHHPVLSTRDEALNSDWFFAGPFTTQVEAEAYAAE